MHKTDPEFAERLEYFALQEVPNEGNMNMGNDKAFLLSVVSQCLPYIGYPRSLNAITCINKAVEE